MNHIDAIRPPAARRFSPAMALTAAAIAGIAFAAGYRIGVARQEKRLLKEFLVNAARLGILDLDRLRELAGGGTNAPEGALHDFEAREGD